MYHAVKVLFHFSKPAKPDHPILNYDTSSISETDIFNEASERTRLLGALNLRNITLKAYALKNTHKIVLIQEQRSFENSLLHFHNAYGIHTHIWYLIHIF